MQDERLYNGRFRLSQRQEVFPLSMDTMALGDFATVRPGWSVWDLGCGSGALGLLLLGREESLRYHGIDLSRAACDLTEKNLAQNGLEGTVFQGRIEELSQMTRQGCGDLVIANPPYFGQGAAGTLARTGCQPEQLCKGAAWLLPQKGRFALIWPAEGLVELLSLMRAHRIEPKRLRLVAHRPSVSPRLVLVEGVKGGKPGLKVEPTLYWYRDSGEKSREYQRIYHEID